MGSIIRRFGLRKLHKIKPPISVVFCGRMRGVREPLRNTREACPGRLPTGSSNALTSRAAAFSGSVVQDSDGSRCAPVRGGSGVRNCVVTW